MPALDAGFTYLRSPEEDAIDFQPSPPAPDELDFQPENGIVARSVNAAKALPQGLAQSVGDSIAGAGRTYDTLTSGDLLNMVPPGTPTPTMHQERRAFVAAMNDPRYLTGLMTANSDEEAQATERLFGPKAKLGLIRAPIDAARQTSTQAGLDQQTRLETNPVYQFGKDYSAEASRVYPTDPGLDAKWESKITRSVGSTVPSVALSFVPGVGPMAGISQYGLSQSEQMAQEALDAGHPELAMQAASAGLFIGALSEATIGVTGRLKSFLKEPTKLAALEGWAKSNPFKANAIIAAVRETAQEGTEQAMQNLTASSLIGYDPARPWHQQVVEAAVLGGIAGGIFGGGATVINRQAQPQPQAPSSPATTEPLAVQPEPDEAQATTALAALQAQLIVPPTDIVNGDERATVQPGRTVVLPAQPASAPPAPEPERLTPEQIMAREATAAMAALRQMKAAAEQRAKAAPTQAPPTPEEWERLLAPDPQRDLRQEGVSEANTKALLAGTKTPEQVVEEQLGIKRLGQSIDATTMTVDENQDGSRSIGFTPEAGPASMPPVNVGQMSHIDAIQAAREQGVERIRRILATRQNNSDASTQTALDFQPDATSAAVNISPPPGERRELPVSAPAATPAPAAEQAASPVVGNPNEAQVDSPEAKAERFAKYIETTTKRKAERDSKIASVVDAAGDAGSVELQSQTRPERKLIVTPEPTDSNSWRVTELDASGPYGHHVFTSRDAAIRAAAGEAFTKAVAGPSYYTAGEFQVARIRKAAPVTPAPPAPTIRRRPTIAPREDGVPDILDAVQQLGGIRPPGTQQGNGEYDGYTEALQRGAARLLRGGSERPDILVQALQQQGYRLETTDDLYAAIQSAVRSREALSAQLAAENFIRPNRVAAVEALYDQAVGGAEGNPVTMEQVGALDATLNNRERRALRRQLAELQRMAATPDDIAQPSEIQQAVKKVKQAWGNMGTMGIAANPEEDARKMFELYKALYALARALVRRGVKSIQEFAARSKMPADSTLIRRVWADANAGNPIQSPHQLDPIEVAEAAMHFRPRKFSDRLDNDPRINPLIRGRVENQQYQPISNQLTAAQALQHVDERGIDGAIADMMNERNPLEPRVRVTLGQAIIHKLNAQMATANLPAASQNALADKAADVADWLTELGTRLGQGVQAFKIWDRMTPEGFVGTYRRQITRTAAAQRKAGTPEFKLPKVQESISKEVHRRAREALLKPVGFQRDEAIIGVLNYITRASGLPHWELLSSLWYANILSGWTTQLRNVAGNLTNLFAETTAHAAIRPQFVPDMLAGLFRGFYRGSLEGARILRTGTPTGTRLTKLEALGSLELAQFGRKGGVPAGPGRLPQALRWLAETKPAYVLNAWKYVFRAMSAADMTFFRSAQEMRARWTARELARREGLTGQALSKRLADVLHNTDGTRRNAEAQATREGLKGIARRQRIEELIEQARPATLIQEATAFGRMATYNQDPQGVLGKLSNQIAEFTGEYPIGRLVVPFTRIVANVFNNALNYTPWGYARMFSSKWMGPDAAPHEYQLQASRATLGVLGLSAIYALARAYDDDEEPYFAITAQGPQDTRTRNQLRETGWQPYSVKIGRRWIQYQITPAAPGLAYLGALQDAHRYRGLDGAPAMNRAAYALQAIGPALISQSFLSGLADFIEDLTNDRVTKTGVPGKFLRRTAGTVIPNLVKQIDRIFDPTVYDDATIESALLRDIPIARRSLKPMLNVLGESITPDLNPFLNVDRQDPLWSTIVTKQAWISEPSKLTMVGNRPIEPDEYYDWIADSGPAIRQRLEVLLPFLQAVPAEMAQDRVQKIVREERDKSRRRLGLTKAMK